MRVPRPEPTNRTAAIRASQSTLESLSAAEHSGCVLCGGANPLGLKLKFRVQPDGSVLAMFSCPAILRSYPATLHGGVISALLDSAMTNALFASGLAAVTAELTVRYIAPVALNQGAVVRAWVERDADPLFYVKGELEQGQKIMARASAKFFVRERSRVEDGGPA